MPARDEGGRGPLLLIAALLLAAGALYVVGRARVPPPLPSAPAADGWWEGAGGFERADADRRAAGKPMALYFHTDWCGWCRKLDADYLRAPEARAFLDGLTKVRVNPEKGSAEAALGRTYGVRGYPTLLILPAGGGAPVRVHPFRTDGQMSVAEFVAACRAGE